MRLLLALVLFLPLAAAGPGACPHGPGVARCHDKLLGPGQDHLVVESGDATVAYFEPGYGGDEPPLHAGYERYASDGVGEEVVVAEAKETYAPTGAGDVPVGWFAGAHLAPYGQDARFGTTSEWRSAGGSARVDAAGHSGHLDWGTFWFWGLQYYYVSGDLDGTGDGYFDAVPLP